MCLFVKEWFYYLTSFLDIQLRMMTEEGKVKAEKFDGKNFGWRKMQIKDLLI